MEKGLIHIYTGDGKGKTTAAIGLCMRAAGREKKVLLCQFLKDNDTGELVTISRLDGCICVVEGEPVKGFIPFMKDEEKQKVIRQQRKKFREAVMLSASGYDLLILDEIIGAVNTGVIEKQPVLDFLRNKPDTLEVVLTGRDPCDEFVELADYVSEIRCVKHPYEKGIGARKGIEK